MSFDLTEAAKATGEIGYGALFGGSSGKQRVFFERGAVMDAEKSAIGGFYPERHKLEGQYKAPVYRDAIMVVFVDPDPPHDKVMREASDEDFEQYAREWEASKKTLHLTPIVHLPTCTQAKREMAFARGLFWVEQIAEKQEADICEELRSLVMIARQYLMIANGQKPRVKLAAA